MARGALKPEEVEILKTNPYVVSVAENRIVYSDEFKNRFIKEYQEGKRPTLIFRDAGLDPGILGTKRIERASSRWRESYAAGTLGKYEDGSIRQVKAREKRRNAYDEKLKEQQKQIAALQTEVEALRAELAALKGEEICAK